MRRSFDLTRDLTTLVVCAVSTVLLTRSFLALAGYPQVGGSKFHIAHVLYGGLLLLAACIVLLAFLSPELKVVAAVLGGIGFGLFIDEVGKFVTKDVNYFYRPAIAIIYVCFVGLFGVIRWLGRRGFSSDEALLIGIETLKQDAVGRLTEERRARILRLLADTGARGPLADGVRGLLESAQLARHAPALSTRLSDRARSAWAALTGHRLFRAVIFALLIGGAAISGAELGWLLRNGFSTLTFSQKAFALSTVAVDALLLVWRAPAQILAALSSALVRARGPARNHGQSGLPLHLGAARGIAQPRRAAPALALASLGDPLRVGRRCEAPSKLSRSSSPAGEVGAAPTSAQPRGRDCVSSLPRGAPFPFGAAAARPRPGRAPRRTPPAALAGHRRARREARPGRRRGARRGEPGRTRRSAADP